MRASLCKKIFGRWSVFCGVAPLVLLILAADAPGLRGTLPAPGGQNTDCLSDVSPAANPLNDRSPFITINVAAGRISLRTADTVLLDGPCSAGSGAERRDPATGRVWSFTTPTGVFQITAKAENPIWKKPDWAYIEEDLPLPENPAERLTAGELGGYSLNLGGGLYIHGTLYTRLLGMNVTHGCIRVGDDDLEKIYHAVEIGTPVYIFNSGDDFAESRAEQVVEIDYGSALIRLLMDGQVVWETSFTAKAIDHPAKSMSNAVAARHVYTGRGEYEDHELAVVADELQIAPEKLQRTFPGRFAIVLNDGSTLDVTADIDAETSSAWDNACFDIIRLINAPFGERYRQLSMDADDALTLYGLARPGVPARECHKGN